MKETSRGPVLTTFAVLFAILAFSNFLKPFHLDPNAGFVFFGKKTHGIANAVLGPVFRDAPGCVCDRYLADAPVGIADRVRLYRLSDSESIALHDSECRIEQAAIAVFYVGIYCRSHWSSAGTARCCSAVAGRNLPEQQATARAGATALSKKNCTR